MKIAVRYYSMTGNTKKIANAIASSIGIEAKTIKENVEEADILFLGGAVYAANINSKLKKFVEGLDKDRIKKVAIFGTSGGESNSYQELKKILEEKNITVLDDNFNCLGRFLFWFRKKPDWKDLKSAEEFARKIIKE